MKLLAIDTSTEACSVGLMIEGQVLTDHRIAPQQHAARVLPMIDALMGQAGITPSQLDAVAYGRGPGSFTGVRIGVAVTQGIAMGAGIGVIGISTLRSMAQGVHRLYSDSHIVVSLDARMDEVYFSAFVADGQGIVQSVEQECICLPVNTPMLDSTCPWVWCGSGAARYTDSNQLLANDRQPKMRVDTWPHAHDLLTLAAPQYMAGKLLPAEQAMPVYLRDKVADTTQERLLAKQLHDEKV